MAGFQVVKGRSTSRLSISSSRTRSIVEMSRFNIAPRKWCGQMCWISQSKARLFDWTVATWWMYRWITTTRWRGGTLTPVYFLLKTSRKARCMKALRQSYTAGVCWDMSWFGISLRSLSNHSARYAQVARWRVIQLPPEIVGSLETAAWIMQRRRAGRHDGQPIGDFYIISLFNQYLR